MNAFEKVINYINEANMTRPYAWSWFHLLCIGIMLLTIVILYKRRKNVDKDLNKVLLSYGIIAFILELIKQLIWAFNYEDGIVSWSYSWYSAPFQLCTTPIFICLLVPFIKNEKVKTSMLSYMCFFTILGSICTLLMPDSCFVETIEVNIHTMFLHLMSLVVSLYLVFTKKVSITFKNLLNGYKVFIVFVLIALVLDIGVYNTILPVGETFNMFYISPYFTSTLPIYNVVQESVPYIVFLLFYLVTIFIGGFIMFGIYKGVEKIK